MKLTGVFMADNKLSVDELIQVSDGDVFERLSEEEHDELYRLKDDVTHFREAMQKNEVSVDKFKEVFERFISFCHQMAEKYK